MPISTYFSALKIKWLIDNVVQVKSAIREDRCAFGTVDSWILWVKNRKMGRPIFGNPNF